MDRTAATILDDMLAVEAKAGSSAAFGQLIERWTPRLMRHAERMLLDRDLAADAVQEAWLGVARGLRRLDDAARFPAWAYAIVTRKCVDVVRRSIRDRRAVDGMASLAVPDEGRHRAWPRSTAAWTWPQP